MEKFGIDERTRDEISGTNRVFLSLIRRPGTGSGATPGFGLSAAATATIASLTPHELGQLSRCPFALFSLGFEQVQDWIALLERGVTEPGVAQWRDTDQEINQFLVIALAGLRGVAGRDPFLARLLYGIPDMLCRPLANLDLAALPILVPHLKERLRARLIGCPGFWRDLLTGIYLGADAPAGSGATRQLGLQLTLQRGLGLRGRRAAHPRLCRERQ